MLNLITNRTNSDVEASKELLKRATDLSNLTEEEIDEMYDGLRGCYGISDLNRVEEAVEYLAQLLDNSGFKVRVDVKTDWEYDDIFDERDLNRYLQNITNLRAAINDANIKQVPDTYTPYYKANDIEKILIAIEQKVKQYYDVFIYSGVIESGASWLRQRYFRNYLGWNSQRFALNKYLVTDTVESIMTTDESELTNYKTKKLELYKFSEYDKINDSIYSLNTDFEMLDELIG